jgi:hypothetical protein
LGRRITGRIRGILIKGGKLRCAFAKLDVLNMSLMYPEQYAIADKDMLLDTSATAATFSWEPGESDIDILIDAYDGYVSARDEQRK